MLFNPNNQFPLAPDEVEEPLSYVVVTMEYVWDFNPELARRLSPGKRHLLVLPGLLKLIGKPLLI
jgi:hypothetical protein